MATLSQTGRSSEGGEARQAEPGDYVRAKLRRYRRHVELGMPAAPNQTPGGTARSARDTARPVKSRTDGGLEEVGVGRLNRNELPRAFKPWEVRGEIAVKKAHRRKSVVRAQQRLVRSRDRVLIVLLGPFCGPNDRLHISVLVYAENHALVDLGLRSHENAAIVFHLDPHF